MWNEEWWMGQMTSNDVISTTKGNIKENKASRRWVSYLECFRIWWEDESLQFMFQQDNAIIYAGRVTQF